MIGQLILSSDWLSQDVTGNKMDSNNLATLFAPNILHSMKPGDGTMSPENSAKAAELSKWAMLVTSLSSLTMPNGNWSGNLAQNFFNVFFRRHRPRQNGSTNLEENYGHLPKIR